MCIRIAMAACPRRLAGSGSNSGCCIRRRRRRRESFPPLVDRFNPPAGQEPDPIPTQFRRRRPRRRCCGCCCCKSRLNVLLPCEDFVLDFFATEEANRHYHRRRRRRRRRRCGGRRSPRVAIAGRRGGTERDPKDGVVVLDLVSSRGGRGWMGGERLSNESDERLGRSETRRRIPRMGLAANSVQRGEEKR